MREITDSPLKQEPKQEPKPAPRLEGRKRMAWKKVPAGKPDAVKVGNRIHVTLFWDEVRELMREKPSAFAVWVALNALAFQRGSPFNASKRELERMLQIDHKTICEAERRLQSLGFVAVASGAKSRKRNGYEMKKGAYVGHSAKRKPEGTEGAEAPSAPVKAEG